MRIAESDVRGIQDELAAAAQFQDNYDNTTICLIAPASPTVPRYCDDLPLQHNAITEGLLGHRPYAGAEGFNRIEQIAVNAARSLFGAEHANVQPHSVSDANAAAYFALLKPGDTALGMRFDAGGHLTHGMEKNYSGRFYDWQYYGLTDEGRIDYDGARQLAEEHKPKLIVCGASSYPRSIDFEQLADIAQSVGAKLMADVSHPAGLIAANRFPQPFPHCDVVTFTPDKTMLGPHGGIILSKDELAKQIDSAVHPGIQSSVPLRRIYGMAECLLDAHTDKFTNYIDRVLGNMAVFAGVFATQGDMMVTGGSDTHLMVVDTLNTLGITGRDAEASLESVGILTNRQVIPNDTQRPYVASGLRLGTSWITGRGYGNDEAKTIANAVIATLQDPQNERLLAEVREGMGVILATDHPLDVWGGSY